MRRVWFTSDWHFRHKKILELSGRPFDSVEKHDAELIARHNTLVSPEDIVWVLGDAAMGNIEESLACCRQMNGLKFLLCGNHDRPVMVKSDEVSYWIDRYCNEGGFSSVYTVNSMRISLSNRHVSVSHYPYEGDSTDNDRHVDRRPSNNGQWLLHGHVHEKWRMRNRQINVGVDAWNLWPVSQEEILEVMDRQDPLPADAS